MMQRRPLLLLLLLALVAPLLATVENAAAVSGGAHQGLELGAVSRVALKIREVAVDETAREQQARLLYQRALGLYNENKIAAAIPFAERAAALVHEVPYLYFLAQASEELGEYDIALRYFRRALEVSDVCEVVPNDQEYWLNFNYAELLTKRIIPRVMSGQDEIDALKDQAVQHYQRALAADRSEHNTTASGSSYNSSTFAARIIRNRFHVLNTIGVLLSDLSLFEDSLPFFEQAIELKPTAVQPLGNLALSLTSLGRQDTALRFNGRALELDSDQPLLLHNMGLILSSLDRSDEAIGFWERSHKLNPTETETISAIAGYYYFHKGDMQKTREYLQRAQQLALTALAKDPSQHRIIVAYSTNRLRIANAQLPYLYQSGDEILEARAKCTALLHDLLNDPSLSLPDPFTTASIGGLGYFAVYQGFNDVAIRSQQAQIYRRGSPVLSFTAPHVVQGRHKTHHFPRLAGLSRLNSDDDAVIHAEHRKIRIGFHSGLMRHHSVGLLTQGVIAKLPRDAFEVIVVLYEANLKDELTERVLRSADRVVFLGNTLQAAQQQIAELELDVLVFTEIGMDLQTYFLAFSRMALRTAVFWGHAVTSGIDTVDYFISSKLFQHDANTEGDDEAADADTYEQQQLKYVECVYEMNHLTTYFLPPTPAEVHSVPLEALVQSRQRTLRESLGLPSKQVLETMFLVPQTLFKLHPDFDILIERVLSHLPHTAFLAVLTGYKPWLADDIRARWRRTLSPQVYKRIYFIRVLNTSEFMDVCAMADIVLDPFPVGGGRSSLEIFAVGTPIVMLAPRTTILQLTAAMYKVMGFQDLIAFTENEFVHLAVQLALDPELRGYFRRLILENNRKLYESEPVIHEWTQFLVDILAAKPPAERIDKLAPRSQAECPHFPLQRSSASLRHQQHQYQDREDEPFFAFHVHVMGQTNGDGPNKNGFFLQLQSVDDDPFKTARHFIVRLGSELDWLQENTTGKMLWNAKRRLHQPVVAVFNIPAAASDDVLIRAMTFNPMEIRFGDDLHLITRAHLQRQLKRNNQTALDSSAISAEDQQLLLHHTLESLTHLLPEHSSPEWLAARSFSLKSRFAIHSKSQLNENCVTLLITTCKRLALFLRTIDSLERALGISDSTGDDGSKGRGWSKWFCYILVIDDNSSKADRLAMQARVPNDSFQFYFKTPEQRGHAKSLNLALQLIRSRYVMCLEDDWEFQVHDKQFLSDALAILRAHRTSLYEPLALVLLNDQHGGWERSLTEFSSDKNRSHGRRIRYFLQEFADADPSHTFSFWPGFSLNPGVWDLHAILHAVGERNSSRVMDGKTSTPLPLPSRRIFDEDSDIFEQLFATNVWRSGLRVAFLTEEHAVHIGAPAGSNASAYVLNGLSRRFDVPATVWANAAFP